MILTYKRPRKAETPSKMIAWDSNLMSLDGFSDDRGYVKIDLRPLYTLHITYENKRRSIQRLTEKKPRTARRLREKYSRRRNNRVRDFLHKLTTEKAREFRDYRHGFEDLDKQEMLKKRKDKERSKRLNREVSTMNWRQIRSLISYKATEVELIDPRGSSRTCPRCGGGMKRRKEWRVLSCGACGLVIDRQLNAAINLYLRMKGFPPPEGWEEHVLPVLGRSGVAPMGAKADEVPR